MTEKEATVHDDPFGEVEVHVPRGGPVSGGRREPMPPPPPLPAWKPGPEDDDPGTPDYSSLESVNRDLLALRIRLNRIRRAMQQAGREAVTAKLVYQRALRRALVPQSGGTAETRRARAEVMCEELEAKWVMAQQVHDELLALFRATRDEAENAKTVAYNLRSMLTAAG